MQLTSKELFFKACTGETNLPRPPVWFMRQAGRYLPEYQAIRKKIKFLELCRNPELAVEVSIQPVEIVGVDAAIIFSDILLPLADFGIEVDFPETGGIKVWAPDNLQIGSPQIGPNIKATTSAITLLKKQLAAKNLEVPVLGFCGAPWTLANYILEGGTARGGDFFKAKQLAWSNPQKLKGLLDSLTEMMIVYLKAQIEAGADAVQLFDTWGGELSAGDFAQFALPYYKMIFNALPKNTPKILFVKGVSPYIEHVANVGADVLSVDWKISLTEAWNRLEKQSNCSIKCLQGNLDPIALTAAPEAVTQLTKNIIAEGQQLNCGHILNLGHGVTPNALVDSAKAFVNSSKIS